MKVSGLLFLFAVLVGIAEGARSAPSLDRKDLEELLDSAKTVLKEIPVEAKYAKRFEIGISQAHAFSEAYDCFYAGWPSQMTSSGGRRYCSRPTALPHYAQYTKDKNGKGFECLSRPETMACNPLLFGTGKDGTGLCASTATVSDRQTAFFQCESQANRMGAKKYDFVDALKTDPKAMSELLQTLDWVKFVCEDGFVTGKPTTQKGTQMCSKFVTKLKAVRPKLSQAGVPTRNDIPPSPTPSKNAPSERKTFYELLNEGSTHKKSADLPTNKDCKDCQALQQREPARNKGFAELIEHTASANACKNWLETSSKDQECYDQIKSKFMTSGKCHRWERLPPDGKVAFKLGLFSEEIRAFRDVITPNTRMSEAEALGSLSRAFNWSPEQASEWTKRASLLPDRGTTSGERARARFQADLMKHIQSQFDAASGGAEVKLRATDLLKRQGLSDCDFPSRSAFLIALNNIRSSGIRAPRPHLLTLADRSLQKHQERLTTFDLNKGEVLFQSNASFGDADPSTLGPEANFCSNRPGSNASPHGMGVTRGKPRKAMNGIFDHGLFVEVPNASHSELTGERGIAFHEAGGHPLGTFAEGGKNSALIKRAISGGSADDVTLLIRRIGNGIMSGGFPGNTDGCVGLPNASIQALNSVIQEGSYVYFHCPVIR